MTIIVKDAGHDTDGLRRVTVQPFNDLDATAVRQAKIQQRQGRGGCTGQHFQCLAHRAGP